MFILNYYDQFSTCSLFLNKQMSNFLFTKKLASNHLFTCKVNTSCIVCSKILHEKGFYAYLVTSKT